MYNKVIMIGNLTRDVELRYLPSGSALATIGLASNRRFKKQDGNMGDEVCFVDVKLFGRTAEIANQYLHKGSKVLIEGRLSFESWNDQSGAKRSRHTIIAETMQMLDSRATSGDNMGSEATRTQAPYNHQANQVAQSGGNATEGYAANIPEINIDEDEIPF